MLLIAVASILVLWALVMAAVVGLCTQAKAGDRILSRAPRSVRPEQSGLKLIA